MAELVDRTLPHGRDQHPGTWPGHETAFQINPDHWAMWTNDCGTTTGMRRPDGTWEHDTPMTADNAPGLMEWHWDQAAGHWCGGYVGFRNRGDRAGNHELVTAEPLTISPSLLCRRCSSHEWIRSGAWQSA